ncbi:F-box protein SKIP24 isoform X1 [Cryptomeria japonica]|uniref:F-box protein SKIP24 isoform X1 n=2 Tax=Cryptomeria japonica TaxID=3369 RepID=UPI0025AB6235|nr:F-box protein SKIP24 isoform X1 [Cryptomeria japonica]
MSAIPDEIWMQIMDIGVQRNILNYRDLSSLAISSRRLCRLSNHSFLWELLWTKDFPSDSIPESLTKDLKSLYKQKFERVKSTKIAAHKRSVLRVQSQALVLERECKDLGTLLNGERRRLNSTLSELKNIERARQSSVALKIWQPEIIHTRQQDVVEQTPVRTDSRIHSLKMEIAVCKERIERFSRSICEKNSLMERVKSKLESLQYKPLPESCISRFQGSPKKAKITDKRIENAIKSDFRSLGN